MKDVVLTTDLYHRHGDPNDHWNLANMYALAEQGWIRFAGIMCDDDRAQANDGSFLHFGDPSVQSVAQLNYITGRAVPVGFGSRRPIKRKEDLQEILREKKKISSVTMLLEILERSVNKVDIHMCGSCKDVLLAYYYAPELFEKKCDCIYLNAGTYEVQDPLEYNVTLEPYAFSQIFNIPCNIRWAPCFHALIPYPYVPAKRASYYEIEQMDMVPHMSVALKKYFNYMYGAVFDVNWLSYLKQDLDEDLVAQWSAKKRQMWSTPGFLLSAGKRVNAQGQIVDADEDAFPIYDYKPVAVQVTEEGKVQWQDVTQSHVQMFQNSDPQLYQEAMRLVVKQLMGMIPEL